jgi:putative addiction module component (TIGR02574 family)
MAARDTIPEAYAEGAIGVNPSLQELGIDRLSIEERLALAQQLWESVAADLEREPLTTAQRAELERRVAAADASPAEGEPWEVIRAEARAWWQR